MKTIAIVISLLCAIASDAAIIKVLNNVSITGTTNTANFSASVGIVPSQSFIVDTTGTQTNYLAVSLDGTNFINVATNRVTSGGTTNFQPTIPTQTLYYRVNIVTTNNTTNTVYFQN